MDKSIWRSIVDQVKPLIPSIDATSSSEDEANIEIFQRPPGLSLKLPADGSKTAENTDMAGSLKFTEPEKSLNEQKPATSDERSPKSSHSNGIVLSFARPEHLDLDALQYTVQDDEIKPQFVLPEIRDVTYRDGDKEDYYKSILEKITYFCEKQSTNCPKSSENVKESYMGNAPEENMLEEKHISPTLFIDLRCQNQTCSTPIMSLALCSFHKEAKQVNRPYQINTGSQTNCWKETGKSMLLRKIRENNEINKCINKKAAGVATNKCNLENQPKGRYLSCVKSEHIKPETGCQKSNQDIVSEKPRDHFKHYQAIVKELEKCRPTKSVGQKQPAAEKTDLLYDIEASSLELIRTLPADIGNDAHMLLIVNLSSPGMVTERGQRKRQKLDSALTKSHIYNTLVAWFLSLVGSNPNSINEANATVPFWVAGLQQLWSENGLALHVFVVAKHTYTQRKKDSDIYAPFYNHIDKYLSETSLSTIAYWLPQFNVFMGEDTNNPPICLPSYYLSSFITATCNKNVISRIFSLCPGFYWHTLETSGHECKGRETTQELHTEVSVALGCKNFFQLPLVMHYTVQTLLGSGLDICGLRLLYPSPDHLAHSIGCKSILDKGGDTQCVLAVAVRGPYAHLLLQGINRSVEGMLRQKAIAAENDEDILPLCTPQQHNHVPKELCLWFSGRLVKDGGKYHGPSLKSELLITSDYTFSLCATTKADILLVVSPLIPPSCYAKVLSTCEHRGFILRGLQRIEIHNDRASLLGFTSQQAQTFCTSASQNCYCLVLILKKENAQLHSITLPGALMKEFKTHNLLTCLLATRDVVQTVDPSLCFHTASYSNNLYHTFARLAWAFPDPSTVVLSNLKCPLDLDMDELVVLTLCGQDMSQGLDLLHRAITQHGFKLLGLKWLPVLTGLQAQEVSPYEVGEKCSHSALVTLMSAPALVCPLRQNDALTTLRKLVPNYSTKVGVWMSPTPQVATRQMALFFFEQELFSCAGQKDKKSQGNSES